MVVLGLPSSHQRRAHSRRPRARTVLTTEAAATPPRPKGPLDPRILALSPALRTHLVISVALAVATAAAVLTQAESIGRLLPRMVDGDASAAVPLAAWLFGAAAVRAGAAAAVEWSATRALVATRRTVRNRVLDRLVRLHPDAAPALGPSRVATLSTNALDALDPWVRSYLPGLAIAVVVPLAAASRILGADPLSALVLAIVIPLIPIFMVLIGKATELHTAKQWDALQRLAGRFLDVITGLPTLRLFGRADAQVERVREVTDRYRQATVKTLRVAFLSALVLEFLATISVALVAVSLGVRLTSGKLDLQIALIVLLLTPECLLPLRKVGAAFHAATAGLDAAVDIGDATALPTRPEGHATLPATSADAAGLVATSVTVDHGARDVRLAATDLTVRPGQVVAVVGPSGAGKSTLLDVLRGALPADAGRVTVDGVAIGDLTMPARLGAVRWVPQDPRPFGATVAESAAEGYPATEATASAVASSLSRLGLSSLADADPTEVSGGELRRLAIARALVGVELGAFSYLLVDEPTAQLDAASAGLVTGALLDAAHRGIGVVIATHDPDLIAEVEAEVEAEAEADADADADADVAYPRTIAVTRPRAEGPTAEAAPTHRPQFGTDAPGKGLLLDPSAPPAEPLDPSAEPLPGQSALRWLMALARPQRRRLLGAQALGILTEVCTVGLAATAAWLVVRAAERPLFSELAVAAVAVRAFGVGKGPLRYAERLASHDATLRLLADLRATVIGRLAKLAPTGLPKGGRGELLTRLVDDIDRLQDLFLRVLGPLVSTLVVALAATGLAAAIDAPAGGAFAVAVVLIGVVLPFAMYRQARHRGAALAEARGRATGAMVDLAENVDELVAACAEPARRAQIDLLVADVDDLERRQGRTNAVVAGASAGAAAVVSALTVLIAGPATDGLSGPALGVLVLLPLAVIELLTPLSAAGGVLARVEASADRVRSLVQRPDPVVDPVDPAETPTASDIALDDVDLAWPMGPLQVHGVDLRLGAGERVVISGPSGSGKSTIAAALVAFLAPERGTYSIGSVASTDLAGDTIRSIVTWCEQAPWFADSTLADNLRIARPAATDDELWAALRTVHLDRWAEALPAGLSTRLERDGSAMSGGERQRLALARALVGDRRVVVFDEPTSHLDAETATNVLHDLLEATGDRSVVLIAHDERGRSIGPESTLVPQPEGGSAWVPASGEWVSAEGADAAP